MSTYLPDIFNIDADPDFYYGEIPKKDFISILEEGKRIGSTEKAIRQWCQDNNNNYFLEYALDPRRALGLSLLGNLSNKKCLDYGCGIGSVSLPAARAGAKVTFADSCLHRLEMARQLAIDSDVSNATFLGCKSWECLPDLQHKYDVIIVNGVLEWVGTTAKASHEQVLSIQIKFLHTLSDLLEPDGRIYLAMENRYALQYLLGYPEDHTEIAYLSLMQREEANKLHKALKGSDFTCLTWGLDEYKEYLPQAGLCIDQAYAIFPDYRFPRMIASLKDSQALRRGMAMERYTKSPLRERLESYLENINRLAHSVYSYAMVLKKHDS